MLDICEIDLTVPTKGDAPRQAPVDPTDPTDPVDPNAGNNRGVGDTGNRGTGDNGDDDGDNGTGRGEGGDGSGDGMLTSKKKTAQDFMTSLGYQSVAVPELALSPLAKPVPINSTSALEGLLTRLIT